jgi:GT2 family glycosyltransferase
MDCLRQVFGLAGGRTRFNSRADRDPPIVSNEMEAPTFTVVMPAFNTADTIGRAVESVLGQTREDFELVVVDDGSTDGTIDVLEAASQDRRIRVIRQENRGAAAARNAAVTVARGHYVSFIDSDDLWLPTYLEKMTAVLDNADAKVGFAYTDAWTINPETGQIGVATAMEGQYPPVPPPTDPAEFLVELLERNFIYNAVTVPRAVFQEFGGFDESLQAAIDYEMWLRITAKGRTGVTPGGLLGVYSRGRTGSISANEALVYRNLAIVLRRILAELPPSSRACDVARARIAEAERVLADLSPSSELDRLWRSYGKPPLGRIKRAIFHPPVDWREEPPPELVEALPSLFPQQVAAGS